ncbi:hypothetical protein TWF106_008240 [Orbilia oligospora]|uniref:Transcription factor CBF/NF-Y/archaeal histone domain-containing protein n=1 Tax=Orbilia oligospora TaxID=2813651 RepID=A0A6G1MEW8_ORBOL|nr:hypothetical protein TWF788_008637 [Orbilia oligospora]KAF3210575.1 hypothetical protein TWF679_006776 [Orbilia oligospora]KAF3216613.1 hypothetical protein TWF106_008240 [Orbilia oligospora]KAF3229146.1 hypothetical protein TWF191_001699 [Orbilia oligospora]KAF3255922.1 hypothetical protein TWF192_002354 [Orbilia oligospora]
MAASKSTNQYPRNVLRRIVKAHSGCNISKNADILIYLDYALFLEQLVKEAGIDAKVSGEKQITARNVKKAKDTVLKKFRA